MRLRYRWITRGGLTDEALQALGASCHLAHSAASAAWPDGRTAWIYAQKRKE